MPHDCAGYPFLNGFQWSMPGIRVVIFKLGRFYTLRGLTWRNFLIPHLRPIQLSPVNIYITIKLIHYQRMHFKPVIRSLFSFCASPFTKKQKNKKQTPPTQKETDSWFRRMTRFFHCFNLNRPLERKEIIVSVPPLEV